jgi:hypothetical protein
VNTRARSLLVAVALAPLVCASSIVLASAGSATALSPRIVSGPGPQSTYTVQPQPAPGTCHYTYVGTDPLPDPHCTPGATNPQVTQADIGSTICRSGYTSSIRPPESVTGPEKTASAAAYGYTGSTSTAEYDHLIPLEIGGDPNDPANLWLEPNDNSGATSFSNTKDRLENTLNSLVCSGKLSLAAAQQAIATNWVTAYQTYVGGSSTLCSATLPAGTVVGMVATASDGGYWIADRAGDVVSCGAAPSYGSVPVTPTHPIVGIAATSDGDGYYLVASDGGVFSFGDAAFHGSTGAIVLNRPVIGMAVDAATGGYWLLASDGGIFSFGAPFHGSTGSLRLNKPIVGMASASGGQGYWLVASDGGIFSFGVPFHGSTGALRLNRPVVGMAPDLASGGYWLVASDGGIFSFGAPFHGSTGNLVLNQPIVAMEANRSGSAYRFVASDGGVFTFGDGFYGSAVAPPAPPPRPSSPPPSSPPPPAGASCTVSMSNASPPQYSSETANIHSTLANSTVVLTKHYKTTTSVNNGSTNGSGNAAITFNISGASVGYTVKVSVSVGNGAASCSSSFTPS